MYVLICAKGKSAVLFALLLALHLSCFAQTVPGVVDNYSGSSGAWLNPSNISTGFVHDDIGIASLSFFLENNFAYMPVGTFWPSLIRVTAAGGQWMTFDGKQEDTDYYFKYHEGQRRRYLYQSIDLGLPAFMTTIAGRHSIAFAFRQRSLTSATRMPWELPVLITESLSYKPMHQIRYSSEGMRVATMQWSEVDLSYATMMFDHGTMKMDAGVTVKLPAGMSGMAINADVFDYKVRNADSLYFNHLDGAACFSLPLAYDSSFRDPALLTRWPHPLYRGWGWGVDVGFTLTCKRNPMIREIPRSACDDDPVPYYWRLGMSLLDAGWIRYTNNVLTGHLVGNGIDVDVDVFDNISSFNEATVIFDGLIGNTVTAFDTVKHFVLGLPTAMSVQFDANPYRDFYCNVTWIQPLSRWLYSFAVEREPLLSLTPRYETSLVSVSVPLTLYGYQYITGGAFVRVGPLTLGTNDLLSLVGLGRTRSIDFLVSLRLKLDRGDCLFNPILDACGDRYRHK